MSSETELLDKDVEMEETVEVGLNKEVNGMLLLSDTFVIVVTIDYSVCVDLLYLC